jgi:hypothetical protein
MTQPVQRVIIWIAPIIGSLLLAGNIFFIVRFIDEQDKLKEIVWQLRQDVVVLQSTYPRR